MFKTKNKKSIVIVAAFVFLTSIVSGEYKTVEAANPSSVYNFTGGLQTYSVPASGIYEIETYGAQGDAGGGLGGNSVATFNLRAGDVLQIVVGGQNGYNGGGAGSAAGGGSTTVNLSGVNLITGAGGGGGSGGTAGGSDTGLGGASVGSGIGGNGVSGGGGGRSLNYSYDNGYYQDVFETRRESYSYDTTEYYTYREAEYGQRGTGRYVKICELYSWETGKEGPGNERCISYENVEILEWGIVGYTTKEGERTVTKTGYRDVQVKTGTVWIKTSTTTVQGLPGKGGTNSIHASGTDKTLINGIRSGNGLAVITSLDTEPPEIKLTPNITERTNKKIVVTANITDAVSAIAAKKWAKGNQPLSYFETSGQSLSESFIADGNGVYTVYARDSIGNHDIKTITISNINYAPELTVSSIDKQLAGAKDMIKVVGTIADKDNDEVSIKGTLGGAEATSTVQNGNGSWEMSFKGSEVEEGTYDTITVSADDTYDIVSEVLSFPTLTVDNSMPFFWAVTHTPTTITSGEVTIQVNIGDTYLGVKQLTRPDGTTTTKINSTYVVSENGNYDFAVEDKAGNTYTHTVEIKNIDKESPELSGLTLHHTSNGTYEVSVKAIDASGIERVTLSNGEDLKRDDEKGIFFVRGVNSAPSFVLLEDKAGNVSKEISFLEMPTINLIDYDAGNIQKVDINGNIDGRNNLSYQMGTKKYTCTEKPCELNINKNMNVTAINQLDKKASLKSISIENIDKNVKIVETGVPGSVIPIEKDGSSLITKPISGMTPIDKDTYAEKNTLGQTYYINFNKQNTDKQIPIPSSLLK